MFFYTKRTASGKIYIQVGPKKFWGHMEERTEVYYAAKSIIKIKDETAVVLKDGKDITKNFPLQINMLKDNFSLMHIVFLIKEVSRH